jgi:demethylmenaquinone methyltransferase/2-methoxy-6-polyprenyl-1,4-benzoquinol methylase
MFGAIAPTYDRVNRIISLNLDRRWRRYAVGRLEWQRTPRGRYLDLCAGTLDFGSILARQPGFAGQLIGADFVPAMLQRGRHKATGLHPVTADALTLPFPDASFDGAMVGWGMRNLIDLDLGLREAARVLRRGARLAILEMSIPEHQPMRGLFLWYFEHMLPRIGRLVSHHATAYQWLPDSTRVFPGPAELADHMRRAGFASVEVHYFLGGCTALHVGVKR